MGGPEDPAEQVAPEVAVLAGMEGGLRSPRLPMAQEGLVDPAEAVAEAAAEAVAAVAAVMGHR